MQWPIGVCRAGRRRILLYLDHELSEPELSRFLAHLRTCRACRDRLAEQRDFLQTVRAAAAAPAAPPALRASVRRILNTTLVIVLTLSAGVRSAF
ncbi:MAG: zf-HC2 domain-containing protein [Bryobacteraceae bacterium]